MSAGFDAKPCAVCGVPIGPGRTATCSRPCQDVHTKRREDARREAYEQQRLELWRRDVHAILEQMLAKQGGRS